MGSASISWSTIRELSFAEIDAIQKSIGQKYHIVKDENDWEIVRNRMTTFSDSPKPVYFNGTYIGLCVDINKINDVIHDYLNPFTMDLHIERYANHAIIKNELGVVMFTSNTTTTLIDAMFEAMLFLIRYRKDI